MPRNPVEKRNVTWENRYGTTNTDNLPRYKITECIESTVDLPTVWSGGAPWVQYMDFHYYHIKCPYSNEAELHYVRNVDKSSPNYWKFELTSNLGDHIATNGMMIKHSKGSKYGWLCVDPNCPYFVDTGKYYFYL